LHPVDPNQPEPATERTTRHLRLCAELADLAMQLARAAAARTLADWAEPEDLPPPEPQIAPQPEPHADREPAPVATPRRAATYGARTAAARPTDPAILFTRLAAVVRDCIALEARLAAVPTATTGNRALQRHADPRRTHLREAFRHITANHPDRAALNRDIATRLDEHLAADPDQTIEPINLLDAICTEFGIELDLATLPDEYLFSASEMTDEADNDFEPCATSPP
jgi:hypothetical protein